MEPHETPDDPKLTPDLDKYAVLVWSTHQGSYVYRWSDMKFATLHEAQAEAIIRMLQWKASAYPPIAVSYAWWMTKGKHHVFTKPPEQRTSQEAKSVLSGCPDQL